MRFVYVLGSDIATIATARDLLRLEKRSHGEEVHARVAPPVQIEPRRIVDGSEIFGVRR